MQCVWTLRIIQECQVLRCRILGVFFAAHLKPKWRQMTQSSAKLMQILGALQRTLT
jgi:hypothetical protein